MFCHTFFFNKKMACSLSISAFMASMSNSIMKIRDVLFPLFERLYSPFSICCLCFVAKDCLDLLHEIIPVLDSQFFVQLIELLLYIYSHYTSSKVSQDCYDPVIGLYDSVTFEKQLHSFPLVFEFCSVTVKPFQVWYHVLQHSCLYVFANCCWCWCY